MKRTIVGAVLAAALLASPAAMADTAQWQGPGRAVIKAYVEKAGGMTDLPFPVALYGDFTGDGQDDAIVFVYTPSGGSGMNLDVVLFTGERGSYRFKKLVPNVFGERPRDAKFSRGVIELTTTMPKPGDPHCCPTGSKRWRIKTD
jgi:hypothetical protein